MTNEPDGPGSFYGRRKGKALRGGQAERLVRLLPQLRLPDRSTPIDRGISDLPTLFPGRPTRVWMEIGFGGGEHLAHQARLHPDVGFIGVEAFVNGVAKLLGLIEEQALRNIRLWDDDAAALLPMLPAASLDRIYLLYPDPWPKRRQRKRRFLGDDTLSEFARLLRPGGELRFATDIDDYAGWALARVRRSGDFVWTAAGPQDWREPWPHWPGTRYEAKARLEGRSSAYLTFRRS